MPELPDLTIYAENLGKAVAGKKIDRVLFHGPGKVNVPREEFAGRLAGTQIASVARTGKQVSIRTDNGAELRVHLMLTGGFALTAAGAVGGLGAPVVTLFFADGSALSVTDPKGWAQVALDPAAGAEAPDAMEVTGEYLQGLCSRKQKTLIKALLIDQSLIGGIGNAYADEILWEARISPKSAAGKLPPEAVASLARAIPAVLENAILELRRGHPDMIAGEYREFLKVHRPELNKSPTGATIVKENISSKRTYYTEEQKLYR